MKKKEKNRNWILIFSSLILFLFGAAIIGGKYLYQYVSKLENDIKIEEYFDDWVKWFMNDDEEKLNRRAKELQAKLNEAKEIVRELDIKF